MARGSFLGRRKMTPKATPPKPWKPFTFYLYLMNLNSETTPTPEGEFRLAQAGLGKRLINMSNDMSHDQFTLLLQVEYPKMKNLTGGYYLYKATGGQGKRRLTVISPDFNDGYTANALEFLHTPEERCQKCRVPYPLHFLQGHIRECKETSSEDDDYETSPADVEILSVTAPQATDMMSPPVKQDKQNSEEKVECPICFQKFTAHLLQVHASACGESYLYKQEEARSEDISEMSTVGQKEGEEIKTVDDVLNTISKRVDRAREFKILISRTNILERGLLQWQRQKKHSPASTLKVSFIGEAGVDTGALRREFLTEMVAGIKGQFFEGPQNQRIPRYSVTDFDNGLFRSVGEIFAVSLSQGGPCPACFGPWTYKYQWADRHNGSQHAIILHAVLRLQPMLEQLTEGLKLFDLLSLIRKYPDICRPLPQLNDKGTNRHQVEMKMMDFLQDFLYEVEAKAENPVSENENKDPEDDDTDGPSPITPARLLQWMTGQGHIPLLPSERELFAVILKFNHDCTADFGDHSVCYPIVSACAKTISLPVRHMSSYEQFKMVLTEAFHLGQEFSKV
ncbi:uncharacterized protein LOC114557815 isoform X2 [Xyrichtys novacula]|uniref:Uncharacterized protein LOC114557815 isoform X2 n=1 Tax=Xyrichtys novacula TaxID=13765 RepID=A0AAV1EXP0_XYRNO|nr:uncharacterized protein LOC114557815 isoform X2 [Xyrichtys novacula]